MTAAERRALYADLAEVASRDAQAIAGAEEPELSLAAIRAEARRLYGPGEMVAWIVADQTGPTRCALHLVERRQGGEHARLEALALRLLEAVEAAE